MAVPFSSEAPLNLAFSQFMDWLQAHSDKFYALIAVRPTAFGNVSGLTDLLDNRGITHGQEPFSQKANLTLGKETSK
jgi:hypothetical protein